MLLLLVPRSASAQCGSLSAVVTTKESRCAATGEITINASGGVAPPTYQYSISAGPVTASFSLVNTFSGLPPGNYTVVIKDLRANCTITRSNIIVSGNYISPGILYNSTPPSCMNGSDGTIFVTNQTGGRQPFSYQLISPSPFNVGATSVDGSFTGLKAGLYYIQLTDSCGGIQTRTQAVTDYTWSIQPMSTVTTTCENDITATIFLTDINGINSPNTIYNGFQYGVSSSAGDTTWFSTSTFTYNIGSSASVDIVVKDVCGNVRSFQWIKPRPTVTSIGISDKTCTTFTATVSGQQNMNPDSTQYCLYDQTNTVVVSPCQLSPVFTNLPLGAYTMRIKESCYDTTINYNFSASIPIPSASDNLEFAYICEDYTATVQGQIDTSNSSYCLYRNGNPIAEACNTTGKFTHLMYDTSYCIELHSVSACIDTIITRCFVKSRPTISINSAVSISNTTCTTFRATLTGQENLTNPIYKLFNSGNNTQIRPNQSSPVFNSLAYGNYCVRVLNDATCYDTTILRCFGAARQKLKISLTEQGGCLGKSNINVNFNGGTSPFTFTIYSPDRTPLRTGSSTGSGYTFSDMPVLPTGQLYKVIAQGLCGDVDSATIATTSYYITRSFTLSQKCPTGSSPNGANDITFVVNENRGGPFSLVVFKKDGLVVNQNPSNTINTTNKHTYTFANLLPATYIFDTYTASCNLHLYDTLVVPNYIYPGLSNSTGYYCDNNSQNISFSAINGVAPYQYQIFGSIPASPNINTPLQTSPVFNINNGTSYSLIRLRVLDACFNASINDVGFVSLAVPAISISNICFNNTSELSVDSLANATYAWYKRTYNPTDSVFLDSGHLYQLPNLSLADTGTYIVKTSVNQNCIVRLSYITLFPGTNSCLSLHLSSTTNTSICSSELPYTWNGKQYTDSGTYTFDTTNASGIDSVATLNLSIRDTSISTTNFSICASELPYSWNGNLYPDRGTYIYHTLNSVGCDSAATLILNVTDTSIHTTNVTLCASEIPYTWNGRSYSANSIDTIKFTNVAGCDSTEILNLIVNQLSTGDTTAIACSSFTWYGNIYTASASPTHIFKNAVGCDSIVTLHLTINNPTAGDTTAIACSSFTWYGNTYNNSTTATHLFTNAAGCDSTVTLHLTINNPTTGDTIAIACSSFTWYGNIYNSSTTATHLFTNAAGCDSTVTLHLTINDPTTGDTTAVACSSFTWYGNTYNSSTTATHIFTNAAGCDSTVTLQLTINNPSTGDTTAVACSSFTWYGNTYTSSATPTHIFTNAGGCDSTVTLYLTINTPTTGDTIAVACSSFTWYGNTYTSSAKPTHIFTNAAGCDSTVTLNLTINNPTTGDTTALACGSFVWYGNTYNSSTTATHLFTNAAGCDSVVTLHLTIDNPSTGDTTVIACSSFSWYGNTYNSSTIATHLFTNAAGCDSTVTLHLTINNSSTGDTTAVACGSFTWYGNTYNNSTTATHLFTNAAGCDSTVTLHLTINNPSTGDTTAIACSLFTWYGNTYTSSATPTHIFTNAVGCDSIVTLHLTINDPTTGDTTAIACSSFTWYGNTYNSSTTATHLFTNAAGCDSTVTLHLTISNPTIGDTTAIACGSFTWYGNTYNSSTTATHLFTNAAGCDSTVTLHLTINDPTTGDTIAIACGSFTWYGKTYNSSTIATHILTNATGCDSTVTLQLTINNASAGDTTAVACSSFTWYGNTYNSSITPTHMFTNAAGCDSIVTLHLTINKPTTSSSSVNICPSELPYIWNGLTFTAAGTQTAHLLNSVGCDSTASLTIILKSNTSSTTPISICPSALPYTWNNTIFNNAGTHLVKLTNAAGCDSLATLKLTVKATSSSTTPISICEDELPYKWNGDDYTTGGMYTLKFTNAAGCDSTAILILAVLKKSSGTQFAKTCTTQLPFVWNGNNYNTSGTYTIHLLNAAGCDSTATLVLTVNGTSTSTTQITVCDNVLPFSWNGQSFNVAGTYPVTLTSAVGCDSIATLILTTSSITPASLGNDRRICPDDTVILYPGKYDTYLWQDGSTNPTYTATKTGTYSVTVSNGGVCSSTSTVNVIVLEECGDIFFPTAISPNGDGLNDGFGALGELLGVSDYLLRIYNRYGELVFETNDPYKRWNGIYKGTLTANYNYVWYSTYTLNRTKRRLQKGNLVLVR
ncbi:MAG: gliding motility-associated C-terminal domain-containing protein [Bacteroidota bacterium]